MIDIYFILLANFPVLTVIATSLIPLVFFILFEKHNKKRKKVDLKI